MRAWSNRSARNALLAEEIELRRHLERVAAQRRALPPGGELPKDFEFVAETGPTHLSSLFGDQAQLRTRLKGRQGLRRHAPDAAQNGFERPMPFVVWKENLAHALHLRPVIPALEQRKVTLSQRRIGRLLRCHRRFERRLKPRLKHRSRDSQARRGTGRRR